MIPASKLHISGNPDNSLDYTENNVCYSEAKPPKQGSSMQPLTHYSMRNQRM